MERIVKYKCSICGRTFDSDRDCKCHEENHLRPEDIKYYCDDSGYPYAMEVTLDDRGHKARIYF